MAFVPQNFVNLSGPPISAAWLNGVDILANSALAGAQTVNQVLAALGLGPPIPINIGGTAATTSAQALINLGGVTSSQVATQIVTTVTQSFVGTTLYPQTAAEVAASVIPVNFYLPPGNVLRYGGNTIPGTTDMASVFQAAVNSNQEIFIPDGIYKIGSTVALQQNSVIIGANRATVVINGPIATYALQYTSPLDAAAPFVGMRFENMTINAKYAIGINQSGNPAHYGSLAGTYPTDVFWTQRYLVMIAFKNLILNGTYVSQGDANIDTNLYPTSGTTTPPAPVTIGVGAAYPTDLTSYGVGIFLAKCFDCLVEDTCTIFGYGIGVMIDGSDINNIKGRFQNNARHVHILAHDSFGYSNSIEGRDLLANRRRGAIFLDSTEDTLINGNYFETFLGVIATPTKDPCGTYITTVGDQNTKIIFNRFDQNRIGIAAGSPEIDLAPRYGFLFLGNDATYDSVDPGVEVQIRETYWTPSSVSNIGAAGTNIFLGKYASNTCALPLSPRWLSALGLTYPVCPHVELDLNNPRLFNTQNPKGLSNIGAASWPYKISGTTGRVVINTTNTPLNVQFFSTPDDLDLLIRINARWIATTSSVNVTWGGVSVFNAAVIAAASLSQVEFTIRRPDAQQGIQPIVLQIADTNAEYESFQLIPVNFQRLSTPPTGSLSSYRVGDIIYNISPTITSTFAWVTTTAGLPSGPAVFSPLNMP